MPAVTAASYPDTLPLREARNRFLAENGFRPEDYSAPTYTVKFWRLPIKFPNTAAHQWATPLHDLHHILTGYRTDWIGEAEIAAWELRAGCKTLVVYWLDLSGVVIGLFIAPLRVWRAFRAARDNRTLYHDPELCDSIMQMTVGEIRSRLGIPRGEDCQKSDPGQLPSQENLWAASLRVSGIKENPSNYER